MVINHKMFSTSIKKVAPEVFLGFRGLFIFLAVQSVVVCCF